MRPRLLVSSLSLDTSEDSVARTLGQDSGRVDHVALVTNPDTGCSRGLAFVEMATETDARSAIGVLDGTGFDGHIVHVIEVQERQSRGSDRGGRTAANRPDRARYSC